MRSVAVRLFIVALLVAPTAAAAYVGPGLGAGAVAAVVGVLGSLALGLFAVVWYPVKRLVRRWRPTPKAVLSDPREP